MQIARRHWIPPRPAQATVSHIELHSPRRFEVESFIRRIFARHYGAVVSSVAPNLVLLEQRDRIVAAAGWRGAGSAALFLERYLDAPVERAMALPASQTVARERIVEIGNLASDKPGACLGIVAALASHLDRLGYEWVVFTATQELVGIFARLGLPLLALGRADPARLGDEALAWGSYYETGPIVAAGRIRLAVERMGRPA